MLKKDRWRLILVVVVVAAALLFVFPIRGGSAWDWISKVEPISCSEGERREPADR